MILEEKVERLKPCFHVHLVGKSLLLSEIMTGLIVGLVRKMLTLDEHLLNVLITQFNLFVQSVSGRSSLSNAEALSLLLQESLERKEQKVP